MEQFKIDTSEKAKSTETAIFRVKNVHLYFKIRVVYCWGKTALLYILYLFLYYIFYKHCSNIHKLQFCIL